MLIVKEKMDTQIKTSQDAREVFQKVFAMLPEEDRHKEVFYVMGLNSRNTVLYIDLVSMGTVNQTAVYIREVFRLAIVKNVTSIIVCHNHPSGSIEPSREDKEITQKIKQGGEILQIKFLDHLILTEKEYFSFNDMGMI